MPAKALGGAYIQCKGCLALQWHKSSCVSPGGVLVPTSVPPCILIFPHGFYYSPSRRCGVMRCFLGHPSLVRGSHPSSYPRPMSSSSLQKPHSVSVWSKSCPWWTQGQILQVWTTAMKGLLISKHRWEWEGQRLEQCQHTGSVWGLFVRLLLQLLWACFGPFEHQMICKNFCV